MAIFSTEIVSEALQRQITFHLILPNDIPFGWNKENEQFKRPTRVLFLLHGYYGSSTEWLYKSNIVELASAYNLAIVLPNGENSFYTDGTASGRNYATFIGEELPNYLRSTFNFTDLLEDTFYIGGFSMGGFGAISLAMTYPNLFKKCFALSSAYIIPMIKDIQPDHHEMANFDYYQLVFGDLKKIETSVNNPLVVANHLIQQDRSLPDIYLACGSEDFLYDASVDLFQQLEKTGASVVFHSEKGQHDFTFWNSQIEPAIRWSLSLDS